MRHVSWTASLSQDVHRTSAALGAFVELTIQILNQLQSNAENLAATALFWAAWKYEWSLFAAEPRQRQETTR